MIAKPHLPTAVWWIIHKDLVCEYRAQQVWPRMLLLGVTVAFLLSYQVNLPPEQGQQIAASLCWVTICFAAVLNLGHSIASERENGCWEALRQYPITSETIFCAKVVVNSILLGSLQLVVVPFFAIASDAPWLSNPIALSLIALLTNIGISALGTLLGTLSSTATANPSILALLLLPLLIPVILAASEATRLIATPQAASIWWHWIQLLCTFAVLYVTLGWLSFHFLIED